jgi:hypothetical protein
MVTNLASHFGSWTALSWLPIFLASSILCRIYIGSTYGEPPPSAFLNDVLTTAKPLMRQSGEGSTLRRLPTKNQNDKVGMRSSEFLDPFFAALDVLLHALDQSHCRLDQ